MNMRRFLKWYFIAPVALTGFAVFAAIGGWIVMSLWNWLLPGLFGLPVITFWQALGLLALCRILFGGFGFGGGAPSKNMTPAERERFRTRMREGVCGTPPGNPQSTTGGDASSPSL